MRAPHLAFALLALGCQSAGSAADCGRPPDYAAWREASVPSARSDGDERTRRSVADHLVRCDSLKGATRREVLERLGPSGLPDDETPRDERRFWSFYLGPDDLGIDAEMLVVTFDGGRVARVRVAQF